MNEAVFTLSGRLANGTSFTIRADTQDELEAILSKGLGGEAEGHTAVEELFSAAFTGEATAAVKAFAKAGAPLQVVPQPQAEPATQQQGVPMQGAQPSCIHGPRKYEATNPKTGKPWPRWECAIPFAPGVQGRCPNISA